MNVDDLPVLVVSAIEEGSPELTGTISLWLWVGEGHIGYLWFGDDKFLVLIQ